LTPAATAAGTIARHQMTAPGDRVLVAFSGGADSTATALLLGELGYDLVLGHVDHGMRETSADDARHCRRVADLLKLPFVETRVTVDPPTQAQARSVRYRALQKMALDCGAGKIATGHTLDDQAETVALRLERGGFGLGIPPVRGNIVRPILDLRRRDTEQVCRTAGIDFCTDPSNSNPRYRRVAVRARLSEAGEPEVARLNALAGETRAKADRTSSEVEVLWAKLVSGSSGEVGVGRDGLIQAAVQVQSQLIRRAAESLGAELTGRSVRDILSKVLPVTGARLALPGSLWVWSERDRVVFGRPQEPCVLPPVALEVPGTTALPGWGATLKIERRPMSKRGSWARARSTELIDASLVPAGLSVRQWQPGDRFRPLNGCGSRKLQDFFVDTGVPRALRHLVPLVVCGPEIVWVGGHRLDDRFKVGPATTEVLQMTLGEAAREAVA
jgi:tRNA(Ile)-lysidine synthase